MVSSNLDEDLDFVRKWFNNSHYYHPMKELQTVRKNAMDRVKDLEAEMAQIPKESESDFEQAIGEVGHILHYVQDVSAPMHVVPVAHPLGDSFENYELSKEDFASEKSEINPCYFLSEKNKLTPRELLQNTAMTTLFSIYQPLIVVKDQKSISVDWTLFWKESADQSFGFYSDLGDSFGEGSISSNGSQYEISSSTYRQYKHQQIRLAVEVSKRTIDWIMSLKK